MYYKDGKALDTNGEFFARLFRSEPVPEQAKEVIQ
jgi:hypothetical protein